jgi:hypothetical protein
MECKSNYTCQLYHRITFVIFDWLFMKLRTYKNIPRRRPTGLKSQNRGKRKRVCPMLHVISFSMGWRVHAPHASRKRDAFQSYEQIYEQKKGRQSYTSLALGLFNGGSRCCMLHAKVVGHMGINGWGPQKSQCRLVIHSIKKITYKDRALQSQWEKAQESAERCLIATPHAPSTACSFCQTKPMSSL